MGAAESSVQNRLPSDRTKLAKQAISVAPQAVLLEEGSHGPAIELGNSGPDARSMSSRIGVNTGCMAEMNFS